MVTMNAEESRFEFAHRSLESSIVQCACVVYSDIPENNDYVIFRWPMPYEQFIYWIKFTVYISCYIYHSFHLLSVFFLILDYDSTSFSACQDILYSS